MKSGEGFSWSVSEEPVSSNGGNLEDEPTTFQDLEGQVPFAGDVSEMPSLMHTSERSRAMTPGERKELEQKMRDSADMFRRMHANDEAVSPEQINEELVKISTSGEQASNTDGHNGSRQEGQGTGGGELSFEDFFGDDQSVAESAGDGRDGDSQEEQTEAGADGPDEFIDINQFATERPGEKKNRDRGAKEEQERTHLEQRLEVMQHKLEQIESDLAEAKGDKEKLENQIAEYEESLDANSEAHDQLSDKVNQLRDKVNKTKRSIISGFTDGLRIVKNLVLGRHQEVRDIVDNISKNVDANEAAMHDHETASKELRVNEAERVTLIDSRANAIDARNTTNKKIANLEKWRADAKKQIAALEEEAAVQAKEKAWDDAREAIKAEMGTDNMPEFRRDLERQKAELEERLQADLEELDSFRHPTRIQRLMRSEEELQREAARADEIEEKLRSEYEAEVAAIDLKLAKVNEYFPTWRERVKKTRETGPVKSSLSTLKRRVLLHMYDAAA